MELKNRKVLVTGADGFIGSHLVEALLEAGAKVKAFCFYNSFNHWGWLDTFPKQKISKLEIFTGDVRDPYGVRSAMSGMDMVFHLAALIGIPYSYHSPDNYVDTNIKGTLNILQAARDFSLKRVFITSTSEVYGTALYTPIDERHALQPQSPYSATKIGADCLAKSFFSSFNLPVTIIRPFNTYGPRQSARAVIPTIITQILSGVKEIKLGDLRPERDFSYVKDVCAAFLAAARSDRTIGEEVNIASGRKVSIMDLLKLIISITKPGYQIKIIPEKKRFRPKKSEVLVLQGSTKKLKLLAKWKPEYSLEQGLGETIEWFRKNKERCKTQIYNV